MRIERHIKEVATPSLAGKTKLSGYKTILATALAAGVLFGCGGGGGGGSSSPPSGGNSNDRGALTQATVNGSAGSLATLAADKDITLAWRTDYDGLYHITVSLSSDKTYNSDDTRIYQQNCGNTPLLSCSSSGQTQCDINAKNETISCQGMYAGGGTRISSYIAAENSYLLFRACDALQTTCHTKAVPVKFTGFAAVAPGDIETGKRTFKDAEGDAQFSYIDLTTLEVESTAEEVIARIELLGLSNSLDFDSPNIRDGQLEYEWGVLFDVDGSGDISVGDVSLEVSNYRFDDETQKLAPILDETQQDVWLHYYNETYKVIGSRSISDPRVSITDNVLELRATRADAPALYEIDNNTPVRFRALHRVSDTDLYEDLFPEKGFAR